MFAVGGSEDGECERGSVPVYDWGLIHAPGGLLAN